MSSPAPMAIAQGGSSREINPWVIALVVAMTTFMEVLDISIANVSLRHIAGDLSAGQDESTWVLTSYLVSNAIVLPISGWFAFVVGRRRFYLWCVLIFTFNTALNCYKLTLYSITPPNCSTFIKDPLCQLFLNQFLGISISIDWGKTPFSSANITCSCK